MISEKKIVSIASHGRMESLIKTVNSIIDQCDVLNITLNSEIEYIPNLFLNEKINLIFSDNSFGDAMKFYNLNKSDGYYLTIDDDIIYPENYIDYIISKCKEYGNEKVITLHGRSFQKYPIISYYASANERYSCFNRVKNDVKVQFGGTGVMCFHTNLFKLPIEYFRVKNMADVWIGKYCIENNIEIICVKHDREYVKYIPQSETIYDTHSPNDKTQTLIVNSIYDSKIKLDFNLDDNGNTTEIEQIIEEKIIRIPIKPTIEKTEKKINYDKVNSVFANTTSSAPSRNKPNVSSVNLKTNSDVLRKLMNKPRRK